MHDLGAPTLDHILDELESILTTLDRVDDLSYSSLQDHLDFKPSIHLINYIRFFEAQGWVNYDRVSNLLALTPGGGEALRHTYTWEDVARDAFSEHIEPAGLGESTDPEDDGDMTAVVDPSTFDDAIPDFTGDALILDGEDDPALDTGQDGDFAASAIYGQEPETSESAGEPSWQPAEDEPALEAPGSVDVDDARDEVFSNENEVEIVEQRSEHTHAPNAPVTHEEPMTTDTYRSPSYSKSYDDVYERQEELGSGGVGTVYKGIQVRLGRPVVIKEIRNIFHVFADVQRDDIVRRFVEIIQTQATLDHPNIIQIYDVVSDTNYPYVVMQHAPKGSLRRLIDTEGRPPLNVAMSYFMQILHALNAAHEQGVVHGGLKPENVVLDPAGNALLTDFGMTQVVERAAGRGGNQVYVGVGTVAYMSPEQFRDPNLATVQSDIYSLGIMFYEMLTGKVPGRRSPMPSSFYPDIPRKLDDIFDRMSMDDVEDRFSSVRDVLLEVYQSPEVMSIMDQRSGVLFLRDPMLHGELGLGEDTGLTPAPATASSFDNYAVENSHESYDSFSSEPAASVEVPAEPAPVVEEPVAEEPVAEEVADEPAQEPAAVAEQPAEEDGEDAGGVLDKLSKYGAMFDD